MDGVQTTRKDPKPTYADLDLRVGTFNYETTRALFEGSVRVDGVRSTQLSTARWLPGVFKQFDEGAVDFAEYGLTFLLRALDAGAPYVAIPAFPNRVFRHSSIFVNADSGITDPRDLVGKTIGEFGVYGQDPGVWAKGILTDEYGFRPAANKWVIGGLDEPGPPFDFTTHPIPDGLEVEAAPEGRSLADMLVHGEIDALFTANVPQAAQDGNPAIRLLFPDFPEREQDYFARTGIFPIMHTVVVRREFLDEYPGVATVVYDAFLDAKNAALERFRQWRRLFQVPAMLPWINDLYERNVALMGQDWWPYGIAANRTALETFLRYHHEQGFSARRWTVEDLFSIDLLDT